MELRIDPRRMVASVFLACVAAEVALFLLDYHVNYGRLTEIGALRRMCNNAREDGLGSWFAITQTFMVALTLWLLAAVTNRTGSRRRTAGWIVLALFFTYMAIDDGAKVHERLGTTFQELHRHGPADSWGRGMLDAFPSYTWQLVFLPVFGSLGLFTLGFLWMELRDGRGRTLTILALGCFVVAVGMDFVEGLDSEHPLNAYAWITRHADLEPFTRARFHRSAYRTLVHFSKSLEECIEMLGNTLLWCVFLRHLTQITGEVRVRFARV